MFKRNPHFRLVAMVLMSTVLTCPLSGFPAEKEQGTTEEQPTKSAYPTFAGEVDSTLDWVRLKDGEWIAGTLRRMRNERLYFHSKKFKEQDINWDDVREVHTHSVHEYVFNDGQTATGRGTISETEIHVETTEGIRQFKRAKLMSIVTGKPSELDHWSLNLGLGATLNTGNTESLSLNGKVEIARRDSFTRVSLDYYGDFGAVDREAILNRHLGHFQIDIFVYPRTVFMPIIAYVTHDEFQNIEVRVAAGPGVGGRIIKNSWLKWDAAFSAGYQYLSYISTPVGDERKQHDFGTLFWTYAEIKFTGDVKLKLEWGTYLVATGIELTNHRGVAIFEVKLTDDWLVFETSTVWTRNESTQVDEDGDVPSKNDLQLLVGFSLRLN